MKNKIVITVLLLSLIIIVFMSACKKEHTPDLNITYSAAFVVNGSSNNISVIKMSDNTVSATISLNDASYPHHIYLNPAKTKLAVAITGTDLSGGHTGHGGTITGQKIMIINAVTGAIEKEIPLSHLPHNAVFNPSGSELWIPQSDTMQGTVLVYKTSDWTLQNSINVGMMPSEVTFSFDGSMAFVANTMDGTVSMIDPNTKLVMQTISVGMDPVGAWPASNGKMYVDNETDQTVSEIDVMSGNITSTINLGFKPGYVAYSTHHNQVWVTDATNGKVVFFENTNGTWTQTGSLSTGADAHAIAFNSVGSLAFVTNQGANTVSVIDVPNQAIITTVPVGTKPNGITIKQ